MKKTMKWLVLALVMALALSAAACGQTGGDDGSGGNADGMDTENGGGSMAEVEEAALVDFYFGVIKDLYGEDSGLNDGAEIFAFDLTEVTNLSDDGKTALLEKIAEEYSAEAREATYQELVSEGAISDPEEFPRFENGLLFRFSSFEDKGNKIKFSVDKWRTALGAYGFTDCTAKKGNDGIWTYEVGGHVIS